MGMANKAGALEIFFDKVNATTLNIGYIYCNPEQKISMGLFVDQPFS